MSHYIGADIEKEWVLPGFRRDTSIARVLVDALGRNGDSTALLEAQTGKKASFRELLQLSTNIAAGLRDLGISAGDYVIICCDKSILAYSLVLSVLYTGATVVMCPPSSAETVNKLVEGFVIKAIFGDSKYVKKMSKPLNPKPEFVLETDSESFLSQIVTQTPGGFHVFEAANVRRHVSMIFFSSGTTGDPKGIQLTDVAIQLCGVYFRHKFRRLMIASPMYWLSAFFPFISSILNNFTLVLNSSTNIHDSLVLLESLQVDAWFTTVRSMSHYINEPSLSEFDLTSVETVFVAGECVLSSVADQFLDKVFQGRASLGVVYGSTEAGMLTSFQTKSRDRVRAGECGRVNDGVEIKILDEKRNVVPVGSLGKVWIRSVAMTPGYWGRPELNQENWDKEGFFDSGDAGFFDKDFNLFLRGRVSDLINYRGKKVSPVKAEDMLMSHPEVLDTAVVGTPHPDDIQHMTAFVELKPGATVTSSQLLEFVNEKVDNEHKLMGGVNFLEALPRIDVGKVVRKSLRDCKTH